MGIPFVAPSSTYAYGGVGYALAPLMRSTNQPPRRNDRSDNPCSTTSTSLDHSYLRVLFHRRRSQLIRGSTPSFAEDLIFKTAVLDWDLSHQDYNSTGRLFLTRESRHPGNTYLMCCVCTVTRHSMHGG